MPAKSKLSITTDVEIARPALRREPSTPGAMLRHIIEELDIGQQQLAREIGVSFQTVNLIIHGKRGVTADVAMRLGAYFGQSPQMWLSAQNAVDLWRAEQAQRAGRAKRLPAPRAPVEADAHP